MTEVLSGSAREDQVDAKLDALLEFCGRLESELKDLRRVVTGLEVWAGDGYQHLF